MATRKISAKSTGRASAAQKENAAKRQKIQNQMFESDYSQSSRGYGDGGTGIVKYKDKAGKKSQPIRRALNAAADTRKTLAKKGK